MTTDKIIVFVIYLSIIFKVRGSAQEESNEDFSYTIINDDPKFGTGSVSIMNGAPKSEGHETERVVTVKEKEATLRAKNLETYFWRVFQNITNFDLANKTFQRTVKSKLKFVKVPKSAPLISEDLQDDWASVETIDALFTQWRDRVQEYLQKKVHALKKLVATAENVISNYSVKPPPFNEACDMAFVDVRDCNETDFLNQTNAIHIPIGVVNCSGIVQRDISWLSHDDLTKVLEENVAYDPTILRQYIAGMDSAVTRLFPVRPWKLDPPDMTVDLFDPRGRHWFIRATTCPKDILFLVDLSGSVAGQTRHLMKLTIMQILTTLTPDDYINAVWYNKDVGLVFANCFDGFVPATTRNKLMLQRYLDFLVETHEADFEKALNFSYDEFLKWDNLTNLNDDLNYGSGCHKSLFVLTDYVQETGHELFLKYGFRNDTLDIRLFGFAMGFNTPDIEALQLLSCRRNGGYFKVDSLEDIKDETRAYLAVLSRTLAMTLSEKTVNTRPAAWTGPYMDAQHEGPVLTLSMPILNKMKGVGEDRFVAVAAIDVTISSLLALADPLLINADSYLFAIDNNGHTLFHPNLYTPEPDLQMIRRAACFEATPAKRRSEADKVIFWEATQEIKMQMGLMDSIFTIDLAEVETPTPQLLQLREAMISGECEDGISIESEKILQINKRYAKRADYIYRCRRLPDIPYSLGLAIKQHRRASSVKVKQGVTHRKINFTNNFVAWIPSPSVYCNGDLAAEKLVNRWQKFIEKLLENEFQCDDAGRTTRLLLDYDAINQWLNNSIWLEPEGNYSCEKIMLSFHNTADLVFIQTEAGMSAFYPKCNYYLPNGFSKDVYQSEYFQYARLHPQELSLTWAASDGNRVTVSAAIHDEEHRHTFAVVGAQVSLHHIYNWWKIADNQSAVGGFSNCWNNYGQSVCYLMNRHYMIIGSSSALIPSSPRLHLGVVEPSLFEHLVNKSGDRIVFTDYQDRCRPGEDRLPFTTSDAKQFRFLSIIDFIFGMLNAFSAWNGSLWVNMRLLFNSLFSPPVDARLPNCYTERPRNDEQCIMQYQSYVFDLNGTFGQGAYYDDGCQTDLYFSWTKIQRTNLFLLEVSRSARDCEKNRPTLYPLTPIRRMPCEELEDRKRLLYRRRYRDECVDFHEKESKSYNEDKCSGASYKPTVWLTTVLLILHIQALHR